MISFKFPYDMQVYRVAVGRNQEMVCLADFFNAFLNNPSSAIPADRVAQFQKETPNLMFFNQRGAMFTPISASMLVGDVLGQLVEGDRVLVRYEGCK